MQHITVANGIFMKNANSTLGPAAETYEKFPRKHFIQPDRMLICKTNFGIDSAYL